MSRNFKARIEALERLEAERAAAGLVEQGAGLPPLATLSDDDVLVEALGGLRSGALNCWHDRIAHRFWVCALGLRDVTVELWYRALAERAQPLIDGYTDVIESLVPPNNGDGRVVSAAVAAVLSALYEEDVYDPEGKEQQ